MFKIKTPKEISLVLSLVLSVVYLVVSIIIQYFFYKSVVFLQIFIVFFVVFAIIYFIVLYVVNRYITAKVRLIYRVMNSSDFDLEFKKNDLSIDVLGKTEREAIRWSKVKSLEIEKLKVQEQFRREFLGNLAHELKTPIFSIQGYILTLLEGGLEDEKINRTFLERANKGVERITRVVEDLDLITEIESGRIVLNQKAVNIKALAKEVVESLEFKAKKRKVSLKVVADFEHQNVFCDKDKISQVLINLINNSIKYSKENGETQVRLFDSEAYVLIEVSDNGVGVSKEHINRLFERFYRVDKSRARNEGGTGLGLSIVKHILDAHNQSISVRSEVGKGSVFYFYLKKA